MRKRTGWMNHVPLKRKLLAIILGGIFVTAMMSFVIVQILSASYNRMLYQTMSESMSYSAKEITDYMDRMVSITEMFLADEKVQKGMTELKENQEAGIQSPGVLRQMGVYVGDYYHNFSDGTLRYIALYTPVSVLKTNLIAVDRVPKEIQREILMESAQKDGALCWVDRYMNEYGLFLARDIRRIEGLKLDTLGTILINADMNALIRMSTHFQGRYGETAYVITKNGEVLYHTDNIRATDDGDMTVGANSTKEGGAAVSGRIDALGLDEIEEYRVQQIDGSSYFISHGTIDAYGWDYYCLVSYEKIGRQIRRIQILCLWITLFDLLAAVTLSARLIGRLMIHVSLLEKRMQQFAQDNTRIPEAAYDYAVRGDEIGTLNRQFDEMSGTIIRLIQENYVNELLKKEAQIRALENQINPHFLYNTLDSIKWRAVLAGEKDIQDMVEALGTLLRTSLRSGEERDYTVGREMVLISSYITIQKLRYESRLAFENQIGEEWHPYRIPKMIIQPLIENAIFYGLEVSVEECSILLAIKKTDGNLHFFVRNTGSEMEDDLLEKLENGEIRPHGHGVGLLNIHKRIRMQYGEAYGLRLYNEDDYAVAELVVPAVLPERQEALPGKAQAGGTPGEAGTPGEEQTGGTPAEAGTPAVLPERQEALPGKAQAGGTPGEAGKPGEEQTGGIPDEA